MRLIRQAPQSASREKKIKRRFSLLMQFRCEPKIPNKKRNKEKSKGGEGGTVERKIEKEEERRRLTSRGSFLLILSIPVNPLKSNVDSVYRHCF